MFSSYDFSGFLFSNVHELFFPIPLMLNMLAELSSKIIFFKQSLPEINYFFFFLNLQHLNKRPLGLTVFVLWFICWCKKIALCSKYAFLPCELIQLLLSGHIPRNPAPNSREQNPDQIPVHLFRSWCQPQHLAKTQSLLGWLFSSEGTARNFCAYSHHSSDWNQKHSSSSSIPTPLSVTIFKEFAPAKAPWSCLCTPMVFYQHTLSVKASS